MRNDFTEEEAENIAKRLDALTPPQIRTPKIRKILRAAGAAASRLRLRHGSGGTGRPVSPEKQAVRKQIIDMLSANMTYAAVARKLGLDYDYVYSVDRRHKEKEEKQAAKHAATKKTRL